MTQYQNIPRRPWKIETTHRGVATHSLRTTALSIQQFLAENNIAVLEQPPYSPDLASYDFFLFPMLKGVIKVAHICKI